MKKSNKSSRIYNTFFTPFKTNRKISIFLLFMTFLVSIIMFLSTLCGMSSHSPEQLKDLSTLALNTIFVVATLGFTIFSLFPHKENEEKKDILYRYIGQLFFLAASAILGCVISYCDFWFNNVCYFCGLQITIINLYFCAMIQILSLSIISLLKYIIKYLGLENQ